ncbi:transcriptional regulator [Streptomyces mashuensis]|uniref:Transcriptional regulator n=1 Tax=Streptomyces mashuensis TaxID=33904 RepID=A0A919B5L4_9ACTN|nr:helix-turn-helix transcriptional regulator [Streptomyces mashuensis]GHF56701.1 transcriptional regulator [Streptomyces mashuensis]
MPPRSNPTARQARLGTELRKLREAAGMSAREAGAMLGGGAAQISHIEAGRWGVSEDRVRRLASMYKCGNEALIDALCAMTREHRGQHWWDEYRGILSPGFLDISELEHHARALRLFQTTYVPGIFQTEEYARALFGGSIPSLPDEQLNARVEHRVRRRWIYEREQPPETVAIVHEAALRMRYGSRAVQQRQLRFLSDVAEWPTVTLRVIPFDMDNLIGTVQSMLYAEGPVPELDTVQMDNAFRGTFVSADALLSMYRSMFDVLVSSALSETESREFLHRAVQEM